ncbi:Diacylglycerol O-acyltransferase 1 [Hypsibius exemplaris]|uniref:O-acyltransferase n=1 Tax=Hypsibius exemplaris TaxID=2072580 RepID=A0A9X6NAB6_HYPEX|nr:Diacylglycerol O-acyltransferase 1 [Hypsibius exemplaris]
MVLTRNTKSSSRKKPEREEEEESRQEECSSSPKPDEEKNSLRVFDHRIHKPRDSLFSSSSGFKDYRGFLNLAVILLILSNTRLLLENIIKYGILVDPIQWLTVILKDPHRWPCLTVCMASNIFVVIALKMEQMLYQRSIPEKLGVAILILNLSAVLIFPAVAVWFLPSYLLASFCTMILYSVVFLKLVSFVMVNRWYRLEATGRISSLHFQHPERQRTHYDHNTHTVKEVSSSPQVSYPDNLTLKNMYYFYFAPTLCYELNYPRTPKIRKMFLAKRILEVLLLTQVELALAQQWLLPIMQNSVEPLRDSDWSKIVERLLKLALPNHIMWIIGFYLIFHSLMNAVAEVMRFADREFYRQWWNAETVKDFWRDWNMPVHRWAVRHLFVPLVDNGFKKWQAACLVFLVSAFFHEYIVSVPLRIFRLWSFMGMLSQIPIAAFVSRYLKGPYGNMAVWMSLIIGQPLAILMYFHDYYVMARGQHFKSFA